MPESPDPKPRPHPWQRKSDIASPLSLRRPVASSLSPSYAELHVTSNFTFLTGASHPEELVEQAAAFGHSAVAITDRNSLAGIVRAHVAAKEVGIPLVVGCRLEMEKEQPGDSIPLSILIYPTDRASYGRLCRLLTLGKRRAPKGECHLVLHDLIEHQDGLLAVAIPPAVIDQSFLEVLQGLKSIFDDDRLSLAVSRPYGPDDRGRLAQLAALSEHMRVPMAATNDVLYHIPRRRALQDVLTCIREGCTIDTAGFRLMPHAEHCLKPPEEMARLLAEYPEAIARSVEIAQRASAFNLDELRYEYPHEVCPPGRTPMQHLRDLTWRGADERYPHGTPGKVRDQLLHEFALIDELNYAPYFLTVHDLVVFARSRGILCQGRGAAANSAVCYCLGVTAVDPDRIDVLFERFVSKERDEPPDIDIDFEHERREEVIQYIYKKYGRDRAAITAEVISYRGRSAVREVGKALGLSLDCVDRLAKNIDWWSSGIGDERQLRDLGLNPRDPTIRRLMALSGDIRGFPRHLSQHVGGFVITQTPLCELVPIENAAMPDRTVIEWDKDDIDAMGMLKVDCLGLGMLTCIRKCLGMVNESDEATQRRSDGGEEVANVRTQRKTRRNCLETDDESSANLSGLDRVAAEYGAGANDLRRDAEHAGFGEVWTDDADATCCGVDSVEHRRRAWATEPTRLSQTSADCKRILNGVDDAVRTGRRPRDDRPALGADGSPPGNRPHSAGPDPQPGTKVQLKPESVQRYACSRAATPSSLRRSVAPSLYLHTIPPEDPAVYDMICAADTVGVFQIESRAQMSMLPRLRPRCFYDLVIEVAIVRPGPIQGDMVHPYLRRRNGEEPVTYPDERVKKVLGKTLGVPLFQEQVMSIAIVGAGFTPGEADRLRRAMAAWKRKGDKLQQFRNRFIRGMLDRGYERDFAERCFRQIEGFSEYGFPESHAASFALLVYVSAWLKRHHPAAFAAALINSQPMGFYAPAQIVRDAKEHGVEVRPVDVNRSGWDCSVEEGLRDRGTEGLRGGETFPGGDECDTTHSNAGFPSSLCRSVAPSLPSPSLRLGMRLVKGLRREDAEAIAEAVREKGPFDSIRALRKASGAPIAALRRLASADAFGSMGLDRQRALWEIRALPKDELPMFADGEAADDAASGQIRLPHIPGAQQVVHDYAALRLSLKSHPLSFLRDELRAMRITEAKELKDESRWPHGKMIAVAGLVLVRQRPATANGIVFMTLEDETGIANLIVRPQIYQRYRPVARHGVVVLARGRVERQGEVVHVHVRSLEGLDERMSSLAARSRNFR